MPRLLRQGFTLAVVLAALPLRSARADDLGFSPRSMETRAELEVDAVDAALLSQSGKEPLWIFPMALNGQFLVHPHVALDVDLPWVAAAGSRLLGVGNLTLGVHGVGWVRRRASPLAAWGGFAVSTPTSYGSYTTQVGFAEFGLLATAVQALGWHTLPRWDPLYETISVPFGLEGSEGGWFVYRVQLSLALSIALSPGAYSLFQAQVAAELEARFLREMALGIRVEGALFSDNEESGGVEPYLTWDPFERRSFFFRAGVLFAGLTTVAGYAGASWSSVAFMSQVGYKF